MQNKFHNKKIVITGATSGIGERMVWHIAKNGGIPIMVSRSLTKLKQVQEKLKEKLGTTCYIYEADLVHEHEILDTLTQILTDHEQIHSLINNAGIGVFQFVKDMKWQDVENMYQLNVFASIRITHLLLPHFIAHGEGHIINIVSQAGKMATPKSAVYGSTKHAMLGFTNALRLEIANENIYVTAVNLGPVRTNFFTLADPDGTYQRNVKRYMLDPDKVAKKIIRNLFTKKREINLPKWMELGSKLYHLFPNALEVALKSQFNKK